MDSKSQSHFALASRTRFRQRNGLARSRSKGFTRTFTTFTELTRGKPFNSHKVCKRNCWAMFSKKAVGSFATNHLSRSSSANSFPGCLADQQWHALAKDAMQRCMQTVTPNPSFEARPNGKPPAPGRWHTVHFHRPRAGVLPLVPPQLER